MDNTNTQYSKIISFNCKGLKRSIEDVRFLCHGADVIALQESWLLPHDLPLLNSINNEFGSTGTSAVDTSLGLLKGRPYGGVALLWRRSAFEAVSVIECDNVRISAIKVVVSNRTMLIFSVYMPTNSFDNLPIFIECLGTINSIIAEASDAEAAYILGDFNAHPDELFFSEMINFCNEQKWYCADFERLSLNANTYTFVSDAHQCKRWLDHCLVTKSAYDSISNVYVLHDVFWSDHYPLVIECNLDRLRSKFVFKDCKQNKVVWGDRNSKQIEKYFNLCNKRFRDMNFPRQLYDCCDFKCDISDHCNYLNKMYHDIVHVLSEASDASFECKHQRKGGNIVGWNRYVRDAHREARLKYKMWVLEGRPNNSRSFLEMCESRKVFKAKLKWCQDRQDQLRMDILASNHKAKDFKKFWKNTSKLNVKSTLPTSVEGLNDAKDVANMFKEKFLVQSLLEPRPANGGLTIKGLCDIRFSAKQIMKKISNMHTGKSPGHDSLSIEHLKYAGFHLCRVLARFFSLCMSHSYLPDALMHTIVVPIVKNKTGDVSDKDNYRPISLATVIAKLLDSLLNDILTEHVSLHDSQFGFRPGLSTESAILGLKHTVAYYTTRRTPVYACFLDLSKAFDLVIYDLLWDKLSRSGVPSECISMLRYWYGNQRNQVRWNGTLSDGYSLSCGVRQGGLTSPTLFNLYINALVEELSSMHVGCYIDGVCVNNLSYADDMVLLSPSISALRKLLSVCEKYAKQHGLKYNCEKSEMLIFKAGKYRPSNIPPVVLNGNVLKVVDHFKYLGHIVTEDLTDNRDIERECRTLSIRSNMLARRFARCSHEVKITLFKTYCQSFYSGGLWVSYKQRSYNALRVLYNNAFRMLLGLPRFCSASSMFAANRTNDFYGIMRKKASSLLLRLRGSANSILMMIADQMDCPIQKFWIRRLTGVIR